MGFSLNPLTGQFDLTNPGASPTAINGVGTIDSATPNANGAVDSSNNLILQSASVTVPGLVNNTTQSFSGNKTFTGTVAASNLSGTNTGDVTLTAVGAAPSANGASLSGQALTLQPADATHPGLVTTGSQTFAGTKTFSNTIAGDITGNATTVTTNANLTGPITSTGNATAVASQTGTGSTFVMQASPVLTTPNLGTPSTLIATNASGTAASLTAGNVTTNANLTGPITSVGNATSVAAQTGTGSIFVMQASPTLTTAVLGSSTATTQTQGDNSTKVATTAYVDTAITGLNPKESTYAASTANIPGTYLNGAAGIGATFTITATGAFTVDGVSPPAASRFLLKDQTSGFQNGVYDVTLAGGIGVSPILTRSLDYNTAAEMNSSGLIPVINGTVNALSSWDQVATITTVGTDSLVFSEFTANPSLYLLKANNLSDVVSGTTSFNNISGMTTIGDTVYGGASGTRSRLAGNITTTKKMLSQTGDGAASAAPTWSALVSGDIPNNAADTTGTATNATNVATITKSDNVAYNLAFVAANSSSNQAVDVGPATYNPSTSTITATTFSGALSGNATTATSATTATNATNVATTAVSTNASYYPLFVSSSSNGNQAADLDADLSYNPSTNTLTATTFSGALSGNATTATTATTGTNATNTAITDDTTTNATMYPTWVTANTGNLPQKVSSSKLSFNPSTGTVTTTTVAAAVTGTASGNTTYSANQYGVVISGSGNAMTVIAPDASTTKVLTSGGTGANPTWSAASTGTVTSVAMSVPNILSVSGSPVTTTGTLAVTLATQNANLGFLGPSSGSAATPTFRALVPADRPLTISSSQTNTYSILTTDELVIVDGTTNAFTATLPTAVGVTGKQYIIKRIDQTLAKAVTVGTTSSQTIDGATTFTLNTQYERLVVVSDGSNWHIVNHDYPTAWVAYTPTFTGFGTVTVQAFYWRRSGDSIQIRGRFTCGTTTGVEARISIPVTSASTIGTTEVCGSMGLNYNAALALVTLIEASVAYVTVGFQNGANNALTKTTASNLISSGQILSLEGTIPVTGWSN